MRSNEQEVLFVSLAEVRFHLGSRIVGDYNLRTIMDSRTRFPKDIYDLQRTEQAVEKDGGTK